MGYARIEAEAVNRHMPEHHKSGQSDCPAMKERETPRYHAEQETNYKIWNSRLSGGTMNENEKIPYSAGERGMREGGTLFIE